MEEPKTLAQTIAQEFLEAGRRSPKPSSPTGDGWPILEKTIPMPEMGIGVSEHMSDVRDKREARERVSAEGEQKQRDTEEAARKAIDAESFRRNSEGWGLFMKMSERARKAAINNVEAVQTLARKEAERDQGFSM
ncbi:hypothetical protein OIU34_23390 [Pararhizobium sp. BT-229]|uniref:hypothetical protein n=1 Tax=Pararhizobium sp. BT-229 TaxID=2986923 RepID=UPI0021F766EB|nr:hypothetical protein [Pararhizobium sp. BT-229]MCV9964841.1 hypothetical protein [Pararhizobium sp. BT-229]